MTGEIAVRQEALEPHAPVTLFRTENPGEVVARASEMAGELAKVVKRQKLTTRIQGRDHVRVEGWTLLGTMLGVFPICEWTRKVENGWEARVEARTLAGQLVGAAEAQCLRSEKTWANRDDYALRSMAQTRATSKALRQPLGFVMTLAGFDATPAEEMIVDAEIVPSSPGTFAVPSALESDDDPVRAKLVGELMVLAAKLDPSPEAFEKMISLVGQHRTSHTPVEHKAWLRTQKVNAERKLAERDGEATDSTVTGATQTTFTGDAA